MRLAVLEQGVGDAKRECVTAGQRCGVHERSVYLYVGAVVLEHKLVIHAQHVHLR